MLKVGIAGIGFMGLVHYLAYQRVPGVKVAAISSRDRKKLTGDWRGIQGNFGPPGAKMELSGIRTYKNLKDLIGDPNVDIIDICLPTKFHCEASVAALKAGKHVFCEKPIALDAIHSQRMVSAAEKAKKRLLIGHIVPFFPEYAFALHAARTGKYGKILTGHFKRVISEPKGSANYFNPGEVGGPLLDLHIHDAHFVRLLFGMPQAVFSRGRMRGEVVEYVDTQFIFANNSQVASAIGGVAGQKGRSFSQGFELHFEQATLTYDFAVLDGKPILAMPLTVLGSNGSVTRPKTGSPDPADGFVAEIREVVSSIKSDRSSPILSAELACDALVLCRKEAESIRTGRIIKV